MKRFVKFSSNGWLDYIHWQKTDPNMKNAIDDLCISIIESPYEGKGNPTRLVYDLQNIWSRRINMEHRVIYRMNKNGVVEIIQCRLHY